MVEGQTMEVLGRLNRSVMSLSTSSIAPSGFASVDSEGSVTLWDTRLRRKDCVHVDGALNADETATELLFAPDQHVALVLADKSVTAYDLRRLVKVNRFDHNCEFTTFLSGPHPPSAASTLMADENGAIIPFQLQTCAPTSALSARYFGQTMELLPPSSTSFGSLTNICCGLGFVDGHSLCAIGMDGNGALYTNPLSPPVEFCVLDDLGGTGGQLLNPPLPNVCDFFAHYIAVGRANGMYSIMTMDGCGGVAEVLSSPGHASNGLCVASWTSSGQLVTCSSCGVLSAWEVLPMLQEEQTEAEEEGGMEDLPPLLTAFNLRDVIKCHAVVNCGAVLANNNFIAGDSCGFVTLCPLSS